MNCEFDSNTKQSSIAYMALTTYQIWCFWFVEHTICGTPNSNEKHITYGVYYCHSNLQPVNMKQIKKWILISSKYPINQYQTYYNVHIPYLFPTNSKHIRLCIFQLSEFNVNKYQTYHNMYIAVIWISHTQITHILHDVYCCYVNHQPIQNQLHIILIGISYGQ